MKLIDRDAIEVITVKVPKGMDAKSYMTGMEYVLSQIDALPTIEERKTGKWICSDDLYETAVCSCCKWDTEEPWDLARKFSRKFFTYCPNCGSCNGGD